MSIQSSSLWILSVLFLIAFTGGQNFEVDNSIAGAASGSVGVNAFNRPGDSFSAGASGAAGLAGSAGSGGASNANSMSLGNGIDSGLDLSKAGAVSASNSLNLGPLGTLQTSGSLAADASIEKGQPSGIITFPAPGPTPTPPLNATTAPGPNATAPAEPSKNVTTVVAPVPHPAPFAPPVHMMMPATPRPVFPPPPPQMWTPRPVHPKFRNPQDC